MFTEMCILLLVEVMIYVEINLFRSIKIFKTYSTRMCVSCDTHELLALSLLLLVDTEIHECK